MTETASQYDKPHIPEHTRAGLTAMNAGRPLAELQGDPSSILARLENESAPAIAKSLGISDVALYKWLIQHCPGEWQAIATARQLARLDECEASLDDTTTDGVSVSRTREKAKLAQWHLERANRKLFGDSKQEGAGKVQIVIQRLDSQDNIGVTVSGDDRPTLPDIS